MARRTFALALVTGAALAGCGGSDEESGQAETSDKVEKPKGDARPRVEGTWRVVFTAKATDKDAKSRPKEQFTWRVTPQCPDGACDFRVRSSSKKQFVLNFNKARGDYLRTDRFPTDCADAATRKVIQKNAYTNRLRQSLKVADSVIASDDGTNYATEMIGGDTTRTRLRPSAVGTCSRVPVRNNVIRAVRVDKPAGKPGS